MVVVVAAASSVAFAESVFVVGVVVTVVAAEAIELVVAVESVLVVVVKVVAYHFALVVEGSHSLAHTSFASSPGYMLVEGTKHY